MDTENAFPSMEAGYPPPFVRETMPPAVDIEVPEDQLAVPAAHLIVTCLAGV